LNLNSFFYYKKPPSLALMGLTSSRVSVFDEAEAGNLEGLGSIFKASPLVIQSTNSEGQTPLIVASLSTASDQKTLRKDQTVKSLIEMGSNLDHQDIHGCTALHYACRTGSNGVIGILSAAGANPSLLNKNGLIACQELWFHHADQKNDPYIRVPKNGEQGKVTMDICHVDPGVITVKLLEGFEEEDFLQVMMVKEVPWKMDPKLGFYKFLVAETVCFLVLEFSPGFSYRISHCKGIAEPITKSTSDIFHVYADSTWVVDQVLKKKVPEQVLDVETNQQDKFESNPKLVEKNELVNENEFETINEIEDGLVEGNAIDENENVLVEENKIEEEENGLEKENESDEEEDDDRIYAAGTEFGAPWHLTSMPNRELDAFRERLLRERIMELSSKRVIWKSRWGELVSPPPEGFVFTIKPMVGHCVEALRQDENLVVARHEIVPSAISEFDFWRCYFWHVELIKLRVQDLLHSNLDLVEVTVQKPADSPHCYYPTFISIRSKQFVLAYYNREKFSKLNSSVQYNDEEDKSKLVKFQPSK